MLKFCNKCKQEKELKYFNKNKSSKDGYSSCCKECQHIYDMNRNKNPERIKYCRNKNKEYYKNHNQEIKNYSKYYYNTHIEQYQEYEKERNKNPERLEYNKKYREQNKEKKSEYNKKYREQNKEKFKNYDKDRNMRFQQNSTLRLNKNISNRLYEVLRGAKSEQHWEDLVGYSIQELKEHLESQFTPEMSWSNYGEYWEIDHIIPVNVFSFNNFKNRNFQICWSLLNLRPLEKSANRSRPKDGRDISEELKQQILGQNIQNVIMNTENREVV